jgi:hypothetical protein
VSAISQVSTGAAAMFGDAIVAGSKSAATTITLNTRTGTLLPR